MLSAAWPKPVSARTTKRGARRAGRKMRGRWRDARPLAISEYEVRSRHSFGQYSAIFRNAANAANAANGTTNPFSPAAAAHLTNTPLHRCIAPSMKHLLTLAGL